MASSRDPRWVSRPRWAVATRVAAVALPVVAAGLASLVVFVLPTPPDAWRPAWWTAVIVVCMLAIVACEPVARRLLVLGYLLEIDVVFPSAAPRRVAVALHASGIAALQQRLAASSQESASDELVTTRMATASALGALRVHGLRDRRGVRTAFTVAVGVGVAVLALVVAPGVATGPEQPFATGVPLGTTTSSTAASPSTLPLPAPRRRHRRRYLHRRRRRRRHRRASPHPRWR